MEEDREYNACKLFGPQIDNEGDVQINEPKINEEKGLQNMKDRKVKERGKIEPYKRIEKKMWPQGLQISNEFG